MIFLLACTEPTDGVIAVDGGQYWMVIPEGAELSGPVLLHLHHSGDGEGMAAESAVVEGLTAAGLVGIFPDGGGEPGDDWNVGINKDDIPRDDTTFLAAVADDLRARGAGTLWLGGGSKGGAMSWEMACLGEPAFDGYLPMMGAIEAPLPHDCTNDPAPIRHLQGTTDDRWPLNTADDPDSSHMGIIDSFKELTTAADGCMDAEPVIEGDCQVWTGCPETAQLCFCDGGHSLPDDWVALQAEGITALGG